MKQIICMNWGAAYGAEYVNRLYNMVERNVTGPFRLVCLTESSDGINPAVECFPCPEIDLPPHIRNGGWRKVNLWAPQVDGLAEGSQALFLDLDIVITKNIDCFFEEPGDFLVCRNWTQMDKRIGNTSVYRFTVGSHPYLLSNLVEQQDEMLSRYPNSQTYISNEINAGSMTFWPDDWCCSFKVHCVPKGIKRWFVEPALPAGSRIVAFPGSPNPHDAAAGHWPSPWFKRIYKHIRPTQWVIDNWK